MIASILVGLVGAFLLWQREGISSPADIARVGLLIVANFGLILLLVWLIARRRMGWPRYLVGGLFALGLPYALQSLPAELAAYPVDGLLSVGQLALQAAALVLIFTGNARAWFAKTASQPASS